MNVSALGSQSCRFFVPASIFLTSAIIAMAPSHFVGAQGAALLFDGLDDFAAIASPSGWASSTSALTIEFWLNPADVSGSSFAGIVSNDASFTIGQHYSDNSQLFWSISDGPTDSANTPIGSLVVGRWDHFACTYDGTTMRIYQNGEPVAEQVHVAGGSIGIANTIFIGIWPSAFGFSGIIDEVRIWNAVRTEDEIDRWMNLPLYGSEPDLLGYWRLDEGAGQVITDSTSFTNNGTLGPTTDVEIEDPQWSEPVPFLAFFFDSFESATTAGWSVTVP